MRVRGGVDLPAGRGLDPTSLPRIVLGYDLGCIVAVILYRQKEWKLVNEWHTLRLLIYENEFVSLESCT